MNIPEIGEKVEHLDSASVGTVVQICMNPRDEKLVVQIKCNDGVTWVAIDHFNEKYQPAEEPQ